jgi:hypothetical protein
MPRKSAMPLMSLKSATGGVPAYHTWLVQLELCSRTTCRIVQRICACEQMCIRQPRFR